MIMSQDVEAMADELVYYIQETESDLDFQYMIRGLGLPYELPANSIEALELGLAKARTDLESLRA